jgi:hypothetical protein
MLTGTLTASIDNDVYYGCTDDMAELRYAGPQHVFLWNDSKFTQTLEKLDLVEDEDWTILHWTACTKSWYVPFERLGFKATLGANQFLFRAVNWKDSFSYKQTKYLKSEGLPVEGRILKCSLKALKELDEYHYNGVHHDRVKTKLTVGVGANAYDVTAWVYFTNRDQLTKYNPHSKEYELHGKHHRCVNIPKVHGKYVVERPSI